MKAICIVAMAIAVTASPAYAASKYLEQVESRVFQTTGDHQAITKRALTCINQIIRPGFINAPTVKSSDVDAGVIVANNGFDYSDGISKTMARTTLTFEAKDGRFKITHTDIEQFIESKYATLNSGWNPVGLWWGSGGRQVEKRVQEILFIPLTHVTTSAIRWAWKRNRPQPAPSSASASFLRGSRMSRPALITL